MDPSVRCWHLLCSPDVSVLFLYLDECSSQTIAATILMAVTFTSRGSRISPEGRRQPIIWPNFAKNCMKMKKVEQKVGAHVQNFTMLLYRSVTVYVAALYPYTRSGEPWYPDKAGSGCRRAGCRFSRCERLASEY